MFLRGNLRLVASLVLTFSLFAPQAKAQTTMAEEALRQLVLENSVMVYEYRNGQRVECGTGTLVDGGRFMVTNRHVIAPEGRPVSDFECRVQSSTNSRNVVSLNFDVFGSVNNKDMVTFFVDGAAQGFTNYRELNDITVGESIFTSGNQNCNPWTFSRGKVQHVWRADNPMRDRRVDRLLRNVSMRDPLPGLAKEEYGTLVMTTKFVNSGNSGGPVVDKKGRLIGVVLASASDFDVILPIDEALPYTRMLADLNHGSDAGTSQGQGDVMFSDLRQDDERETAGAEILRASSSTDK